jgi:hypothetical protein
MEQLLVLNENKKCNSLTKKIQIANSCENKVATQKNTIATSKIAKFATSMKGQLQLL